MDVHCSTCNEPWDSEHLRQDAVFEIGIGFEEAEVWISLPGKLKLSRRYRQKFSEAGWEFGQTVINVIRCPACPKDAKPDPASVQTKAALEQLLADDEDGLAATFEEHQL